MNLILLKKLVMRTPTGTKYNFNLKFFHGYINYLVGMLFWFSLNLQLIKLHVNLNFFWYIVSLSLCYMKIYICPIST